MWLTVLSIVAFAAATALLVRFASRAFSAAAFSVEDLLNWSEDVAASATQLQKAYDWRINQWSNLANALLAATLAFISTCVVEVYKESFKKPHLSLAVFFGITFSLGLCLWCQIRITRLRNEFVALYSLLAFLAAP
jgi:hypothetical protein